MPIISHNLELYGFGFEKFKNYWAGDEYTRMLDRELPDNDTSWTTSTSADAEIEFIFLDNVKQTYYIDGTVTGHFKCVNDSASTDYTLGLCGIRLTKIDKTGVETEIGGFIRRFDNLGDAQVLLKSQGTYFAVPFKFDVKEFEIAPQEKLILYVRLNASYNVYRSDLRILHSIKTDYGNDLFIRLPLSITI